MICLTFDSDYMDEGRMAEFLETIGFPGRATVFCTQAYTCIGTTELEVGPHPTLDAGADWTRELEEKRALFPEARGWRSHSCVFSHLLAEWLAGHGYNYVSTNDQFGQSGIQAIRHPWGLWHLPIYYMDNMDFSGRQFLGDDYGEPFSDKTIERALADDGLYVFDFHPIHLLLNTPDKDHYFAVRDRFKAGESLDTIVFPGAGTRSFFDRLCAAMSRRGLRSLTLGEALDKVRGASKTGPDA